MSEFTVEVTGREGERARERESVSDSADMNTGCGCRLARVYTSEYDIYAIYIYFDEVYFKLLIVVESVSYTTWQW